jgi:molybdate transport system substrate-binding protein
LAILCSSLLFQGWPTVLAAEEILVAVASNFTAPMVAIVAAFEAESGHQVEMSFGSSGRFFAQIGNGAPYQVLFSADQEKPLALVANGLAVDGSQFTYALGALVLWSADARVPVSDPEILRSDKYQHLAIANPRLAPYGQAAMEVLQQLGLAAQTRSRLVQGENITQTYQFVKTGNAEIGFVALSQVMVDGVIESGSGWVVPADLHQPIRQDAVLLRNGASSPASEELLQFMRGSQARRIIASYGYRRQSGN